MRTIRYTVGICLLAVALMGGSLLQSNASTDTSLTSFFTTPASIPAQQRPDIAPIQMFAEEAPVAELAKAAVKEFAKEFVREAARESAKEVVKEAAERVSERAGRERGGRFHASVTVPQITDLRFNIVPASTGKGALR